jgi:hypothetical protein
MKFALPALAALCLSGSLMYAVDSPAPTVSTMFDKQLSSVEREFVSLAEAMPADKYSFAPTQGEFKGVRTFAQQVKHVAATNYGVASMVLGEKPPVDIGKDEKGPDSMTSKDEIVKFLKGSFAYCHKAEATLTKDNLTDMIDMGEGQKAARGYFANIPIWHSFDHYGQMVEYARMNGIVPPASRPQ